MRKLLPLLLLLALPLTAQPPVISGGGGSKIEDADADTSVDVEASADADTVVVTTGGVGGATFTFSEDDLLFETGAKKSGFGRATSGDLYFYSDGGTRIFLDGSGLCGGACNAASPRFSSTGSMSTTNPGFTRQNDLDTGMGLDGSDVGSLIAGGSSIAQWSSDGTSNAFTLFESATQSGASFQILESDSDAMVTVGHSGLGGSGTQLLLSDASASGNTELAWTGNAGIGSEGWRAQYLNASGHLYFRPIIAGSNFVVQDSAGTVQHTLDSAGGYTLASGQLLLPDGATGATALAFSDTVDMGLYKHPTLDILSIQSNGAASGVIVQDGRAASYGVEMQAASREIAAFQAWDDTASNRPLTCYDDATDQVCVIQGSATQASDMFAVKDSVGTDYLAVGSTGDLTLTDDVLIGNRFMWSGDSNTYIDRPAVDNIRAVAGGEIALEVRTVTAQPYIILGDYDGDSSPEDGYIFAEGALTTDIAGSNFYLNGSRGTGTGEGGDIIFQTAPSGVTGSSQNAWATALTIDGETQDVTLASGADVLLGDQLTWVGDEDTYLYQTAANHIALVTGTRSLGVFQNDLTFGTAAPLNCGDEGTNHRCTVQATATQNSSIFVVEDSSGTDYLEVGSTGDLTLTDDVLIGNRFMWSGDGNTYMDHPSADTIRFVTGGLVAATINSTQHLLATVPHGEMGVNDSATTLTLTNVSTWYPWAAASCGDTSGVTCSTVTDDLTVDAGMGGTYLCIWSTSFTTDTNNQVIRGTLSVDGTEDSLCEAHRKVGTGADVGNMGSQCLLSVAAASSVQIEYYNETSGGVVLTPVDVNVSCYRLGS